MESNTYNGTLTAEKFLFYEMRIVSKRYLQGESIEDIINYINHENLFQYPSERMVSRIARACHKRLGALNNDMLVYEIANAPSEVAKQINLYAMMRYNRLVREFMIDLIGDKYRQHDFSFSRKDLNIFFSRLSEQHDDVAAWSTQTIAKLKQILTKCLVETGMLDRPNDATLNQIMISTELETGIKENNDLAALAAFNCLR